MFDPGSWNASEAAFYVSTILLIVGFVILGIGAWLDEKAGNRPSQGAQAALAFGGALLGLAGLGYIKWALMFFFR